MASKSPAPVTLTAREIELLCVMSQCLKSKPEVDIDMFASMAGFGTKASAQVNLARVFRKLKGEGAASPETKKKGGGRKRKAVDDDSEQNEEEETPSKKKGRTKKGTQEQEDGKDALVKSESMDEELD